MSLFLGSMTCGVIHLHRFFCMFLGSSTMSLLCYLHKLCSSGEGGTDGKDLPVCTCMCGSAHDCGCVVDGSNAMAASRVLLLLVEGYALLVSVRVRTQN